MTVRIIESQLKINLPLSETGKCQISCYQEPNPSILITQPSSSQVNTDRALDMGLCIENFSYCDNIRIARRQPGMIEYPLIHVELQDPKRRSLTVICKVTVRPGGSLRVSSVLLYMVVF